jgi:UDP-GlcNAc3NAcA epimerase
MKVDKRKIKIATISGARPQFIKIAAVSRIIAGYKEIKEVLIHTGQHYDQNMSDIFFREMEIPKPDYNLDVNQLNHGAMTGRMLEKIERVLLREKPGLVLVYGDTNSTLAGALAAKKLHIKIAHVEAGLRSFNMEMPEEVNRILTDRISDILFCPTDQAVKNLGKEGFHHFDCKIVKCGDVMLDAALFYSQKSSKTPGIMNILLGKNKNFSKNNFVLCTIHRPENINHPQRLTSIVEALLEISKKTPMVFPIHPGTRNKLEEIDLVGALVKKNIILLPPVGYFDMLELLKHCRFVMTDSGGLQKEAYFFKKYCITLRDQTEWVELVEAGKNFVAGADKQTIIDYAAGMAREFKDFNPHLYGDGNASKHIIEEILKEFEQPGRMNS